MRSIRNDRKPIRGWGINDYPYPISDKGIKMKEYNLWKNVITRALGKSNQQCYDSTSIDPEFKYFSKFLKYIQSLKGYDKFMNCGWHLDSDLLCDGEKSYKMGSICFIPAEINTFLTYNRKKIDRINGEPLGVCLRDNGKFYARACKKHIGTFEDEHDAERAYLDFVNMKAYALAEKYKGDIDHLVYERLTNFIH